MHILSHSCPPSARLHARYDGEDEGHIGDDRLLATAVPQSSVWPLKGIWPLRPTRRHIARNFCCLNHDKLSGINPHAPEAPMRPPRGVCSLAASLAPSTPAGSTPAPLQPHDPDWGDKDGDRTGGDVICHRPGADPEVEAADEEAPRRQRRRVAGRGCRRHLKSMA